MLSSQPWGGFSDFQDDSAIALGQDKRWRDKWSRNGPETVRFSSRHTGCWRRTLQAVQGRYPGCSNPGQQKSLHNEKHTGGYYAYDDNSRSFQGASTR